MDSPKSKPLFLRVLGYVGGGGGLTTFPCQVNEPIRSKFVAVTNQQASNRVDNDHVLTFPTGIYTLGQR
jgi:hypothetical protein